MTEQNTRPTSRETGFHPASDIIELKPRGFSPAVFQHGRNPQHLGALENPDGYAEVFGWCGEKMEVYLRLADAPAEDRRSDQIAEARFVADGCISTMACGEMVTTLARGRTLAEALAITPEMLQAALGGLPPQSIHCSELSVEALNKAIQSITGEG